MNNQENMELELFQFIDATISEFQLNQASYSYVEGILTDFYEKFIEHKEDSTVSVYSRIKGVESLKEKLIRNKFYLHYKSADEALNHLTDLIGITIECRFIKDEAAMYKELFSIFNACASGYNQSKNDPNIYLNLHMSQPQLQRNGFTIYRLDGYYLFNGKQINYELQIKALVHTFWSEIEHEVVYKNPEFVVYDRFLKEMLATVRDSLDVVDRQLETVYEEIGSESRHATIGMDAKGFKTLTAGGINELMNQKMRESVGFTTDFKKCSALLAQYIYIHDFVNGEDNKTKMVDYLEHLNLLTITETNFKEPIILRKMPEEESVLCKILKDFWCTVINTDFEWHVFFVMLFAIQPGNDAEDFTEFLHVIYHLLLPKSWYEDRFASYSKGDAKKTKDFFEKVIGEALVEEADIQMIHEDHLYSLMKLFQETIEKCEIDYPDYASFTKRKKDISKDLSHRIAMVFR